MKFSRRKDEYRMFRRLFKGFQQGIERTDREHMNLVDDVDALFQ